MIRKRSGNRRKASVCQGGKNLKKIAFVLLVIVLMLVGTSCVHHYPYEPDYWFQAIGDDGEYVLTADVERLRNGEGGRRQPDLP